MNARFNITKMSILLNQLPIFFFFRGATSRAYGGSQAGN